MKAILSAFVLGLLATPAVAQNCFRPLGATSLGGGGDIVFGMQPIGFAFPLGGATYTDVHVTSKGYVWLSNAGVPAPGFADFSATAAELALESPRVCALWSDIQLLSGVCWINSSPTQCTITWKGANHYQAPAGNPLFDIQMTLFSSGIIECIYGPGATNESFGGVATWQVGVAGVSPGLGAILPAASDLSASGATADDTLFEEWITPATFDMQVTGLTMIPTNPGWVFFSGPSANCASVEDYGVGCVAAAGSPNSFYEFMPMASFDLDNTTISMLRSGQSYLVLNTVPGTFVPPTGGAQTVATGFLDGQQQFTLSTAMPVPGGAATVLNVTTKGQIEVGGAASPNVDFTPSATELLANPTTVFACWHDYNQTVTGSGIITFEEVGGFAYVTWNGVFSYQTTTPNTFQFQFNLATGDVTLVILTMAGAASIDSILVGYSHSGNSADPGPTDLSSAFGALLVQDDTLPLSLTSSGLPTIGNSGFAFVTSNVPALIPAAFLFVGDTQFNPGFDLTGIGMPGCAAYTNANLGSFTFAVSPTTLQGTHLFPIPNNPGLAGLQLTFESIAFSLATPLNLIGSNGTKIAIGF